MATTFLRNLVDPEVMADIVSATLPKRIKFSPIANVNTMLVAQPGDTISIPKYAYVGPAEDVAEGVAMGTTVLTASTTRVTVKKAGKSIELTDESVLSGLGDPLNVCGRQIALSIADKVDYDCYDALTESRLVYDGTAAEIAYSGIVEANAKFEDESDEGLAKIMYIHPLQESKLRKDENFIDRNKHNFDTMDTGVIGMVAGAQVKKSKKVKKIMYVQASAGTITIVADSVEETSTSKHLDTILANCLASYVDADGNTVKLKVGDKVNAVSTPYYACPIVVVDIEDPNEDPDADANATTSKAITIYMKRDVMIETDRDILKKTTVVAGDEHYVAALSNESKVVLANFKA